MADTPASAPASKWTTVHTLICITAAIGFAFDTYELLMAPLIMRPAIVELGGFQPGSDAYLDWVGKLFYIPAIVGGIFGLWGGWLTDRLGRRRVLTGSILLYAFSAFVAGYSTSLTMLLICRCLVFIGVCVEFVAAVAWLAELFDDPVQREKVIGYTQACASFGGLLVAIVNHILADLGTHGQLPTLSVPNWATGMIGQMQNPDPVWRLTMMSGLFPALPLILIRPFLPESPKWAAKAKAGQLKRPSIVQLFTPELRRATIISTLLMACGFGMAFGGLQQLQQIVPGISTVKAEVAEIQAVPAKKAHEQKIAAIFTKFQEVGGLVGRFILAYLALRILSRKKLLAAYMVPALVVLPVVFYGFYKGDNPVYFTLWGDYKISLLSLGVFVAGAVVIGQFSFWGNYLPAVFPLHLRGTGESMAANIGGRLIGTSFAYVTTQLAKQDFIPVPQGPSKIAYSAMLVTAFLGVAGCVLLFLLPEPPPDVEGEEHAGHAASVSKGR